MKRFTIRGLLAVLMFFCFASAWAYDFTDDSTGKTIYYNITSDEDLTVEVTYSGSSSYVSGVYDYSGDIVIPSTVEYNDNTYSVTSIGASAFSSEHELTSIVISNGVTSIESYAFYDCTSLTSAEIPGSVISIEDYAFFSCSALTSVKLSEGLESIGDHAFYCCYVLPSIEIPGTVKSIGMWAFVCCYALTSLDIPNSVKTIGEDAFCACTNLRELTIGEGVDSIGMFILNGQNISVLNYNATSISSANGGSAPIFYGCVIDTFNIGANVTKMRMFTFSGCTVSELYSFNPEPPELESNAFSGSIGVVFVPEDESATYANADTWSSYTNMIEMTVTIPMTTDEGYVTRYSPYSYVLEPGLKGGIITNADADGTLTIDWLYDGDSDDPKEYTVPADLAILVKGPTNATDTEAENHSFVNWTINTDNDTYAKPSGNMLYGTVVSEDGAKTYVTGDSDYDEANYYFYKLSYYTDEASGKTTLGFYWGEEDGGPITLEGTDSGGKYSGVKRAWLAIPQSTFTSDAKCSFYSLEDTIDSTPDDSESEMETTGITSVPAAADGNVIYNLQGVRVSNMSKQGIYIVNGRKVIKK